MLNLNAQPLSSRNGRPVFLRFTALMLALVVIAAPAFAAERLRVIIETDDGGDPDDEQSLVRFLLYANEWDVEGIIATRPLARPKENLNRKRTGLGIVQALLKAYADCYPKLVQHDRRFPTLESLWPHTVAGYASPAQAGRLLPPGKGLGTGDGEDGVRLIMSVVDSPDPRPIWFCNWGTDHGSAESSLKRALDRVLRERGPAGYAKFKNRLRLSSDDQFGEHTTTLAPPWTLWVDTFRPERDGKRWYHRFSALTAKAGGFDLERDVRSGHGPLGALYLTNTTHWQKEGDTMTFLYLVPTGLNEVEQPGWGSWAGRYGPNESFPGRRYYWANAADAWHGTIHRDNTLQRWAAHLQNDFKARLDWCVNDFAQANHPPVPKVEGPLQRTVAPGETVLLDASGSYDLDERKAGRGEPEAINPSVAPAPAGLKFEWIYYPESGTWPEGALDIKDATSSKASFIAPQVESLQTLHLLLIVTDRGEPPLTRYQRLLVTVDPGKR